MQEIMNMAHKVLSYLQLLCNTKLSHKKDVLQNPGKYCTVTQEEKTSG